MQIINEYLTNHIAFYVLTYPLPLLYLNEKWLCDVLSCCLRPWCFHLDTAFKIN